MWLLSCPDAAYVNGVAAWAQVDKEPARMLAWKQADASHPGKRKLPRRLADEPDVRSWLERCITYGTGMGASAAELSSSDSSNITANSLSISAVGFWKRAAEG